MRHGVAWRFALGAIAVFSGIEEGCGESDQSATESAAPPGTTAPPSVDASPGPDAPSTPDAGPDATADDGYCSSRTTLPSAFANGAAKAERPLLFITANAANHTLALRGARTDGATAVLAVREIPPDEIARADEYRGVTDRRGYFPNMFPTWLNYSVSPSGAWALWRRADDAWDVLDGSDDRTISDIADTCLAGSDAKRFQGGSPWSADGRLVFAVLTRSKKSNSEPALPTARSRRCCWRFRSRISRATPAAANGHRAATAC